MKTVKLGQQGLKVPAVGLGCMGMSEFYGQSDDTENLKILDEALEIGCNFWDTSDMYGPFTNERLLGKALEYRREKVILATKFGVKRGQDGSWLGTSGSPEYVKACCDASLKRLNTDHIDLYYQHRTDPHVPVEETIGAMARLVQAGKIRFIGLSEASSIDLEKAHHTHPISALQTELSSGRGMLKQHSAKSARTWNWLCRLQSTGPRIFDRAITQRSDLDPDDWRLSTPRLAKRQWRITKSSSKKLKKLQ